MYFDLRLFAMTQGLRLRILLAALVGLAGLPPLLFFGFMALLDLRTALVFLACSIFSLVVPSIFHDWNGSASLQRREAYSALGADFLDGIQGLATLKAFGRSRAHGALLAE